MTPASTVRTIARDLSRLAPDWRDPERYFANRDELAHALRRLANQLETPRG
jgi:hypothetical protein